jgi:Uma2 family endonuclease
MTNVQIPWTSADLELLPNNNNRYEIINGELYMTHAPHWKHQKTIGEICRLLGNWSSETQLGEVIFNPGVIFSDTDNVIPDLIWMTNDKLNHCVDESGHFTSAPELVVEVLSPSKADVRRDKESKLKLYSNQGVQEYWIVDWRLKTVEVYRREKAKLGLVMTLLEEDELTSPLLPDFSCQVNQFFV